jgi:hypothetical protein
MLNATGPETYWVEIVTGFEPVFTVRHALS